ncbi:MAG: ribosome maturation factor RimM [Thermomicrobiales bacterium]|nr:ribosome maturation factor RimM [Thermomicrobiales bacterium]
MKDETNATSNPAAANGESVTDSPSSRPVRVSSKARARRRPPTLRETRGPEPTTPVEQVRLTVGRVGGSHGVRGEMRMHILTDEPEHLKKIKTVYLGERDTPITLESVRFTEKGALIKLEGTDTPEVAGRLSGLSVKISGADARPLQPGEYFLFQLIGLKVRDEQGTELGVVTDLIETGAHDVLVIGERPGTPDDLLVPNHPEFVLEMEPAAGYMIVRPPLYE